jgi:hypothetical protein
MFELIAAFFGLILVHVLLDRVSHGREEEPDEEILATFEVELEDINGVWYCWIKDHQEGYSFIGQSTDKDELEQQFVAYAKRKYSLS